jgi:uncharacterized membrane protein
MKRSFLTGLALLLPALLTLLVLWWLFQLISAPLLEPSQQLVQLLVKQAPSLVWLHTHATIHLLAQLTSLVILFCLIVLFGLLAEWWGRHELLQLIHRSISWIPIGNKVYEATRDVVHTFGRSDRPPEIYQVTLSSFPLPDCYVISLATGVLQIDGQRVVATIAPPVPLPHHGFVILKPATSLIPINLSVDQALRFVVSAGTYRPET